MPRRRLSPWINIVALLVVLVVNGLASALPIAGQTTGEISDRFDVYFVPAGYVFSIWGLIYLALIGFAIYQVLPSQRNDPRLARIDPFFVVSCIANASWIVAWHYEQFALSVLFMLLLLISLIVIYLYLGIGRGRVAMGAERWLLHVPFSLYLGWITVATVANITTFLEYIGWGAWGIPEPSWSAIMMVVGLIITTLMMLRRRDVAYGLVIIWAYIGIAVNFPDVPVVNLVAWLGAALVVIQVLAVIVKFGPWGRTQPGRLA
jgi:hypothetical protein